VAEAPPPRRELSASEVWQDIADGLFSLERGLPYTFATLWWKPATQARRYVATRDPTLIRPLRYLLVSVAFYSAVVWTLISQVADRQTLGLGETQMAQLETVLQHAGWLVLLILPLVALIVWLLAWGSGLRLLEALVLLAYAQAQVLLAQALLVVPAAVLGLTLTAQLAGLAAGIYMVAAIAGFIPGNRWRAWAAAIASVILGTLLNGVVVAQFLQLHARLAS
jgi:hypothetical protein